jgi:hypothetical protein
MAYTLADLGTSLSNAMWGTRRQPQCQQEQEDSQMSDYSSKTSNFVGSKKRRASATVFVAEHLKWLDSQDARKVCRLKKVHKLGFGADEMLTEYFEQWGPVEKVLLCNVADDNTEAQPNHQVSRSRLRPAGIGWVVMQRIEDALALLDHKPHQVQGRTIDVLPFFSYMNKDRIEEGMEEETLAEDNVSRQRWADM